MKEKVLIGAGGFAREVRAHMNNFNMKCFVDEEYFKPNKENIFSIQDFDPLRMQALIVVGDPNDRKKIFESMPIETEYFTFIHSSAQLLGNDIKIGKGSFISANCIITTNVHLGEHTHLNLSSTIGHDCIIDNFFTTAPGAKISGKCKIEECVYVGTNASIKEKLNICSNVTIGLQSGVVKDVNEPGVYVGCPAKRLS
jgi:sugar O-acyltransferase (sialic acid O-acetyltransferase NeuD family)